MLSRLKALTNRRNAQKSTGPKTSRGKRVSGKNSTKHGLNVEIDFESSDAYASLKSLLAKEGYSSFEAADIATSLLNYRRVMDAYYDTYTKTKEVDESTQDVSLAAMRLGLRRIAKGSEVVAYEIQSMARILMRSHNERHQVKSVFSRLADCQKLMRYQRNAISRLSKAIRSE